MCAVKTDPELDSVAEKSRSGLMSPIEAQQLRNAVHMRVFGAPADPIRIGRYTVLKRIGAGGMGIVYAAYDTELDRKVAVKVLATQTSAGDTSSFRDRLRREAQALAKLSHPNVVQLYDVSEQDGRVFLSMEFIEGPNLREWIDSERRPWRAILDAYIQAGRGLAAAHAAGIIHRDFKPENALVGSDGRVRVLDFGLARGRTELSSTGPKPLDQTVSSSTVLQMPITRSGVLMGTPAYMAPEQHEGEPADERSDQFSFCVALYEALYGERPFAGKTLAELRQAVLEGAVRAPPRDSRVPAWIRRAVLGGLAVDKGDRHASMEALQRELGKDPAAGIRLLTIGVLAVAIIVGVALYWRVREVEHASQQSLLQVQADEERARRQAAEREVLGREDALTLREVSVTVEHDPTHAVAMLRNLSSESPAWESVARMIAADADHRGIAERVLELPDGAVPHELSPDGRIAVTRNPESGEVRLLEIDTGATRLLGTARHGLPVVAFSPNGDRLAAQRLPSGLTVWDTGSLQHTDLGDSPKEHHFLLVTDDSIFTYGRHPEVHRWSGTEREVFDGHQQGVVTLAVDPANGRIATVDGLGNLKVWHPREEEPTELEGQSPLVFSPTGQLAHVLGHDVAVVDLDAGSGLRLEGSDAPITALAFSPGGQRLAAGIEGVGLTSWDLPHGERSELGRGMTEVLSLRWVDDRTLGSTNVEDLALWSLDARRAQLLHGHNGVAFWAHRNDATIVTIGWEGSVRTWRIRTDPVRPLVSHEGPVSVVAHATATDLVTGGHDGTIRLWSLAREDGHLLAEHDGKKIAALAMSADGTHVASADVDGAVRITSLQEGTSLEVSAAGEPIVAWHPDGRLAVGTLEGGLRLYTTKGVESHAVAVPGFEIRSAGFSHDGESVITIGERADDTVSIQVIALATGEPVRSVDLGRDGVLAVAFSPYDRFVAHTSYHRVVYLWEAETGTNRALGGHDGLIRGVSFTPDGRMLATAADDGIVKLWNPFSGQSRTVALTEGRLFDVAFSPDGRLFTAVGSEQLAFRGHDDLPRTRDEIRDWVSRATNLELAPSPIAWLSQ
jgi:WD40 repeat protein/predicted Ser/Thr protein kinase